MNDYKRIQIYLRPLDAEIVQKELKEMGVKPRTIFNIGLQEARRLHEIRTRGQK